MARPVELVLIGAGNRGAKAYAPFALDHSDQARFVAVVEPDPVRRERFAQAHRISPERRFASWEDWLARHQPADGVLICTPDRLHAAPAIAALEAGYDVLLEKALAPTLEECVRLVQTAERTDRQLQICHVLRYTPFFSRLHAILESGRLGDIVTVEHRENVAYWHMAHSFVRGNWRNSALSSPMILSKCCHDLDILAWNLGRPCERLSSVGSLVHFRVENAGPAIPARCTDGCPIEPECPFSTIGLYLEQRPSGGRAVGETPRAPWPVAVLTDDPSDEGVLRALRTGPYGRCVYRCDNDVVDHQVVTMAFAGGASVILAMHGHSHEEYRSMRYDGTRATLRGRFGSTTALTIHDHRTGRVEEVALEPALGGHGGGDYGLMAAWVRTLRGEEAPRTDARGALESHLLAFAAEESRLGGAMIEMGEYRARAERAVAAM